MNQQVEQWKVIPDCPEYEVSTHMRIRPIPDRPKRRGPVFSADVPSPTRRISIGADKKTWLRISRLAVLVFNDLPLNIRAQVCLVDKAHPNHISSYAVKVADENMVPRTKRRLDSEHMHCIIVDDIEDGIVYPIPGWNRYGITRQGRVMDLEFFRSNQAKGNAGIRLVNTGPLTVDNEVELTQYFTRKIKVKTKNLLKDKLETTSLTRSFSIPKLLFMAFIGEIPNLYKISFINGNPTDWRIANLEIKYYKEQEK